MKYILEVDSKKAVEVLTVNGKEYKRTWTYQGGGVTACDKNDFWEMISDDGYDDKEVIDKVYDVLDGNFFLTDVLDLCRMEGEADRREDG